ncbi:MAG: hypothetical protein ACFFAE_21010 [Candidatus Hodarchaeota archaeon]
MTLENVTLTGFPVKGTMNASYWIEEFHTTKIKGDLAIQDSSGEYPFDLNDLTDKENFSGRSIWKRNWKTGWLEYDYSKYSNETHVLFETKLIADDFESTTGLEILTMVPVFIVLVIYIRKRR